MIKFTVLGCGSSLGVPRIDGFFGKCDPSNIKNYRTRCCAHIKFNDLSILIDTSPDLRFQLIKNKINNINYVFYTHAHADQTHGINDLRAFYIKNREKLDVYADNFTRKQLISTFGYCFKSKKGYPAILKMNNLKKNYIFKSNNKKLNIETIMTQHGFIKSASYLINKKIFYGSDVSKIYEKDFKNFRNLDYLIIDCLLYKSHPSHFSLENALSMIQKFKPKKGILTNLSPAIDYKALKKLLPTNVVPAHDGLTLKL